MAGSHTTERQGKTGSNAVAGDLRLALRDDQLNGRKKAVEALRNVETNEALEVLKHALCDRDPRVRKDVAGILHSRSWQPKNDVEQAHYLIAQSEWDESIRLGEPAVKPLIQALDYEFPSGVDRAKVVEALGYIGGPVASEALMKYCNIKTGISNAPPRNPWEEPEIQEL